MVLVHDDQEGNGMTVMIGVDPHKGSHTAVAIDGDEVELAAIQVRSSRRQVEELLGWAAVSRSGRGRWSRRAGSAICSRSSSSLPVNGCSLASDSVLLSEVGAELQ